MTPASQNVGAVIENLYRTESRRIFATLVRLLGDFDLADESLDDARIAHQVSNAFEFAERLGDERRVTYLVLDDGCSAFSGEVLRRSDLS